VGTEVSSAPILADGIELETMLPKTIHATLCSFAILSGLRGVHFRAGESTDGCRKDRERDGEVPEVLLFIWCLAVARSTDGE
jgi:hypothetical protein